MANENRSSDFGPWTATRTSNTEYAVEFTRLADRVARKVREMSSDIDTLTRLVARGSPKRETHDFQQRINDLQESIRQLARTNTDDIKELSRLDQTAPTEDIQRHLLQQRLAKDFADLLQRFERAEQKAVDQERVRVKQARESLRNATATLISLDEAPLGRDYEAQQPYGRQRQEQQALDSEIEYNENLLAERERGIREIESTMLEINKLFRDVGSLVHDQGQMLDNIESNIVSGADQIQSGHEELIKAGDYQRKRRNCKCTILFMLFAILIGLVLLTALARAL